MEGVFKKVSLADLGVINIGLTHKPQYVEQGVPFLSSKNISKGYIDFDEVKYISEEKFTKMPKSTKPIVGDILFTRVGSNLGNPIILEKAVNFGIFVSLGVFRVNSKVYNKYLCLWMDSFAFWKQVDQKVAGGAKNNLNTTWLKEFQIPLPPLPEQQKIAQILSTWDKAIEQTQKLIEQLKNRKKGLMQQLLTGKTRLKGFSGEWEIVKLGEYLIKHNETSDSSSQYPVLTSSRRGLFFQKDYYTREVASIDNSGYNVVPRGFFTYRHMSDDLIFKFNINNICDKGIVSTLYPVFNTKSGLNKYYLLHTLNEGVEFKRYALMQKQGGSRTYMYYGKLCNLKLPIPTIEEQNNMVAFIDSMDNEIKVQQTYLAQLQAQKKGLMQQLLTGQKRVKC